MTTSAYPLLETLRNALAAVPGVASCRIGLEANMSPADYPMVRLVPSALRPGSLMNGRNVEMLIYFGQPIHEFSSGLEAQYEALLAMEATLLTILQQLSTVAVLHRETVLDEDRVDAYKLMALRVEVLG